jgi:glycine/D-amino acid oxidase-like deaminating enzyme
MWREYQTAWSRPMYTETGALWMFETDDDSYVRGSVAPMQAARLTLEELTLPAATRTYPQIRFDGVKHVWWEKEAGFLFARAACDHVREACVRAGVEYVIEHVKPGAITGGTMADVIASTGTRYSADAFVFACGPWMGPLFPDVLGQRIRATRQDVLYFGTPAGSREFELGTMPVWVNFGSQLLYGIPGNERRGFKVADDTLGVEVNPTSFERLLSPTSIESCRKLLRQRFPSLANAPLVHSEVCQYERSADGHFLMDWHPGARNVLLLGGGSGHGFKMGPAIGEQAAATTLGERAIEPLFAYERLRRA